MSNQKFLSLLLSTYQKNSRNKFFSSGSYSKWIRITPRYFSVLSNMGCRTSRELKITPATTSQKNHATDDDDYVTEEVCCETDLNENEMKVFDIKDAGKVLLIRQKGKFYAVGTKCTHYGANLVHGALGDGRVRCQWHGACFNIETGDIEDFPGLDSLPCHQVITENCKVKVRAKRSALANNFREKELAKKDSCNDQHYVILGGGPSAAVCVETLRQEKFTGKITMVCKENALPYDRVKVSKTLDVNLEKNQLRSLDFYKEHDIEVLLGTEASHVETSNKTVSLSNGTTLNYTRLYVATGSDASKLKIPGSDLQNVVTVRTFEDGRYILSQLGDNKNVVINGSSFIAMETAAACVDKAKSVTVIFRGTAPFKSSLGEEIGLAFMKLFKEKGVNFKPKTNITEIVGNDGKVAKVQLDDGSELETDLLIMGLGAAFNTKFLRNSGLELRKDGSIEVNDYMQTNIPDVYVGGDIAYAPVFCDNGEKAAIGHYPLAHYHGRIAALNMVDRQTKLRAVPYFWTMLFGKGIRYAGHGAFKDIIYVGEVNDLKFVAFYINDKDEVVAASSCGMDPIVSQFAELLYQGRKLTRNDLQNDPLAWTKTVAPQC